MTDRQIDVVDATQSQTPMSILVVDDDDTFRSRLARALESRGFEVRGAPDYETAITAVSDDPPELAVVDLKMPGRSGLDLVHALHEMDTSTRILVLTGYGSIATAVEAIKLGATNYLTKPANADDVLLALGVEGESPDRPAQPATPSLARTEWEHIQRVLKDCDGNISEAARRLGVHRRSLQRKLGKYPPMI